MPPRCSLRGALHRRPMLVSSLMVRQIQIASAAAAARAGSPEPSCNATMPREGFHPYPLLSSVAISDDTKLLRFALPDDMRTLGLPLPSCLKIKLELQGGEHVLDKSYSPISLPDQPEYVELLVKGYPPRTAGHPWKHGPPGGLGAFLINLEVGQTADLKLKSPRIIHDGQYFTNRWAKLGLVAGGTGVAPLMQMIRTILADPAELTKISLVFANRHIEDILLQDELDGIAADQPDRFRVRYVLSSPPTDGSWAGGTGWVSADDVAYLPEPSNSTMVMVCGTDEFMETVSGDTQRAPPPPGKNKGPKIQGPLIGVLRDAGYAPEMVYKF
jgi:cytochrome-b5 reductase